MFLKKLFEINFSNDWFQLYVFILTLNPLIIEEFCQQNGENPTGFYGSNKEKNLDVKHENSHLFLPWVEDCILLCPMSIYCNIPAHIAHRLQVGASSQSWNGWKNCNLPSSALRSSSLQLFSSLERNTFSSNLEV